jgi:hypothetical protein
MPNFTAMLTAREIELAVLERRAASIGVRPSVLARNLIREGLADPNGWVREAF